VIVVSDAGPLIYLGAVGCLALLGDLFDRVVVPRQVWFEVVGAGEVAAIGLCLELRAELLLCDDLEARRLAAAQGIRVVGTLGLLVRGKRAGRLDAVRPIVNAMVAMGLRVSADRRGDPRPRGGK
jgi:uncharacterized protein